MSRARSIDARGTVARRAAEQNNEMFCETIPASIAPINWLRAFFASPKRETSLTRTKETGADFIQLRALSEEWKVDILFFNGNAVITYYEEICKISFPLFHIPANSLPDCHFTEVMALGPVITPHHAFLTNKLLTDLLSDLISMLHMSTDIPQAAPAYIEELRTLFINSCEADYSMDELAMRFNVNRYRMTREFSQFVGMTPVKFLNNTRIEKARALIESTDLSIGAVGTAVGIPNTTHFINLFKEKLGVTPQVYREGYRSFRQISKNY